MARHENRRSPSAFGAFGRGGFAPRGCSEAITRQLGRRLPLGSGGSRQESWEETSHSRDLLRLGFQAAWALGEKERAVQWMRTHAAKQESPGHLLLQLLLETKDREIWLREYGATRREQPTATESWEKTFEHAQHHGELPAWQIS